MMVAAEREKPGHRARHWKQPMPKASFGVSSSSVRQDSRNFIFSTTIIIMAPTMRAKTTVFGVKRYSLMS